MNMDGVVVIYCPGDENLTVKTFLATGTSDSPENIFKALGIDITKKEFWDSGLDKIESLLDKTEELAKKLGKI